MSTLHWIELVNFAAASSGLIIALIGFFFNIFFPHLDRWNRKFFTLFFGVLIAYIGSDLITSISIDILGEGYATLTRVFLFCESLFSSMLMLMLTRFLLHYAGEDWRRQPVLRVACGLWAVYFAALVITQFTTVIYTITPQNVYSRGPWYPALLVPPILLMLLNLVALWRRRRKLTRRQQTALTLYLLIPLGCMVIQMFSYGLLMIVIGTSLASLLMFSFIVSDHEDSYFSQQREIARQRASIMVLQMRPHFISNTMTSIYYLIQQDPEKAQQVTLDFTTYLRKNFTALALESLIPFSEELEHTRAYLAVEQVRFEGSLFVEIDAPHTDFRLPPLTLQPIVENAVRHGIDPELEPLHVTIRTRRTGQGSVIVVEDTGPGYSPADDHAPHIALANIRERLNMMCRGTLDIAPGETGGTRVTVAIPEKGAGVPGMPFSTDPPPT